MRPAGDDGHFAAGSFASLSAVEVSNAVAGATNIRLPGTLVFDYPSVRALATHVHSLLVSETSQETMLASPSRQLLTAPANFGGTNILVQVGIVSINHAAAIVTVSHSI